jgi:opacity protein-like surface antigen
MFHRSVILVAASIVILAAPASAARWEAGGHFIVAQPTGEFDKVVNEGYGLEGYGVLGLEPTGMLGLRVDLGFVNYGDTHYDTPLSPTIPVRVRINTSNNIGIFGIGPQFAVPEGPVRPYVYGTIGLAYFYTPTSANDLAGGGSFATDNVQSSTVFAWSTGGGLRFPVSRQVSIDLGLEYRAQKDAEYLTEGDLYQDPGTGDILIRTHNSDADLVLYRIGVNFSSMF